MTSLATNPIAAWTAAPATATGIHFWRGRQWERWPYPRLADLARRIAGGMVAAGVGPEDRVVLVERTGPEFVASLFATMLAGAVPCPVAPPQLFQSAEAYSAHFGAIAATARPALVIAMPELVAPLTAAGAGQVATATQLAALDEYAERPAAATALLQFTSGSSGRVKGVRVPVAALAANLAAIRDWTEMGDGDATASWLPVHHDMGLIGTLLTPVVEQRDLWLMESADFVREPARYLGCFSGERGAVMTAMPPFGLDFIARRVTPEALAGSDFSRWRALILGAERIDVAVLDRFLALVEPYGFSRLGFLPAYGLAEATLAVTGLDLRTDLGTATVSAQAPSLGDPVPATGGDGPRVVGCGTPLGAVEVSIVDDDGVPLPDDHLGQIVVTGDSVAAGYVGGTRTTGTTEWRDGQLWTGDAGFLRDGQLFVIGRLGDAMKLRGRTVFAEDVEAALVAAGVPRTRLAVLLGAAPSGPAVVVLLEKPDESWVAATLSTLPRLTEHVAATVLAVPRRSIRRTTSGKPKRREMWTAHLAGELDGERLDVSATPAPAATTNL